MRNQRGSDPRAVTTSCSRGIMGNIGRLGRVTEDKSSVLRVVPGDIELVIVVVLVNNVVVAVVVVVGTNPRGPSVALRRVTSENSHKLYRLVNTSLT